MWVLVSMGFIWSKAAGGCLQRAQQSRLRKCIRSFFDEFHAILAICGWWCALIPNVWKVVVSWPCFMPHPKGGRNIRRSARFSFCSFGSTQSYVPVACDSLLWINGTDSCPWFFSGKVTGGRTKQPTAASSASSWSLHAMFQ